MSFFLKRPWHVYEPPIGRYQEFWIAEAPMSGLCAQQQRVLSAIGWCRLARICMLRCSTALPTTAQVWETNCRPSFTECKRRGKQLQSHATWLVGITLMPGANLLPGPPQG